MINIQALLPKASRAITDLLKNTEPKRLPKLDEELEAAVMKAWVATHGTGQRRSRP